MTADPLSRAVSTFTDRFGAPPDATAFAPGRVNLMGDHTDYCEGFVLPAALHLGCACALGPAPGPTHELVAADFGEEVTISVPAPDLTGHPAWTRYLAGVITLWHTHHHLAPSPLRAVVSSSVPPGSGLASSAALEVALATALDALHHRTTTPAERARVCREAEHQFAGVPCGIMDQLIACTARRDHAMLIDCRTLTVDAIPLPAPEVAAFLLIDTGVRHRNDEGAYADRRSDCERAAATLHIPTLRDADVTLLEQQGGGLDARAHAAASHVITENARVHAFATALRRTDLATAGHLMTESHVSLSRTYRVSCPEADALVKRLVQRPGVHGARMTGAGFGGWVVALMEPTEAARLTHELAHTTMLLHAGDGCHAGAGST